MATELLEPLRSELSQTVAALRLHIPVKVRGVNAAQHARGTGRGRQDGQIPTSRHHLGDMAKTSTAKDNMQYSGASSQANGLRMKGDALTAVQVVGDLVMKSTKMPEQPKPLDPVVGGDVVPQRTKVHRTRPGEEGRAVPREGQLRHGSGTEPIASKEVAGALAQADAAAKLINSGGAGGTRDAGARPNRSPGRRRDERDGEWTASLNLKDSGSNFGEGTSAPPDQRLPDRRELNLNGVGNGRPRLNMGQLEASHGTAPVPKPRDDPSTFAAAAQGDRKLALLALSRAGSLTDCRTATAALTDCRTANGIPHRGNADRWSPETMSQPPRNGAPSSQDQDGGSEGFGASSAARGLYETAPVSRTGARRLAGVAAASTRAGASMQ